MGFFLFCVVIVVDFFLYHYWSAKDYSPDFIDYTCIGIFFIGVSIQVSLDWLLNQELRLLNYFQAIKTFEDKAVSLFAIAISFGFGAWNIVQGVLILL